MSADVTIGIGEKTVNKLIASLFGMESWKKWFSGTQPVTIDGTKVDVAWKVNAAPQLDLEPPDDTRWNKAVHLPGATKPVKDGFVIQFPSLTITPEGEDGVDAEVLAFCHLSIQNGTVTFVVHGAEMDLEKLDKNSQIIFTELIIPGALAGFGHLFGTIPDMGTLVPGFLSSTSLSGGVAYHQIYLGVNMVGGGAATPNPIECGQDVALQLGSKPIQELINDFLAKKQNEQNGILFTKTGRIKEFTCDIRYQFACGKVTAEDVSFGATVRLRGFAAVSLDDSNCLSGDTDISLNNFQIGIRLSFTPNGSSLTMSAEYIGVDFSAHLERGGLAWWVPVSNDTLVAMVGQYIRDDRSDFVNALDDITKNVKFDVKEHVVQIDGSKATVVPSLLGVTTNSIGIEIRAKVDVKE